MSSARSTTRKRKSKKVAKKVASVGARPKNLAKDLTLSPNTLQEVAMMNLNAQPEPGFLEGLWMWVSGSRPREYYGSTVSESKYVQSAVGLAQFEEWDKRPQYLKRFTNKQLQKFCVVTGKNATQLVKLGRSDLEECALESLKDYSVSEECAPGFFRNLWQIATFSSDDSKLIDAMQCDFPEFFNDSMSLGDFAKMKGFTLRR